MKNSHDITTNPINDDTICAISTPHGCGGIAVIRLSGSRAMEIADSIWHGAKLSETTSHTAHLGWIVNPTDGERLDQGIATVFRAPTSYTGDDTIEFSVHGSEWIQAELLRILMNQGARMAEAGEFTRRAFVAGHIDLTEAEAVADLIASNSKAAHKIAVDHMRGGFSKRLSELRKQLIELSSLLELELDFSEEEVEFASRQRLMDITTQIHDELSRLAESFTRGAAIKSGIPVAIVGATNAGKSSLLNRLLGDDRAIVSDIHGTTRDTIEDSINIGDYRFRFIDTAGLRDTADCIEQMGINRSIRAIESASIIIAMADANCQISADLLNQLSAHPTTPTIIAINKIDTAPHEAIAAMSEAFRSKLPEATIIHISALCGNGTDLLLKRLEQIAREINGDGHNQILITNLRHAEALNKAKISIERVIEGLHNSLSGDFIAQDLRETLHILSTILGEITTPDILSSIFSRFCIGK